MSFVYRYEHGEANFGPPIENEASGGAHLTFDVILRSGSRVLARRLPEGMHDGPKNALYFPHGLIRFGESVPDCVQRLVDEQLPGPMVRQVDLYTLPTWVDDDSHWHLCLNVVATIDRAPDETPGDVSELVWVRRGHPGSDFGWWTTEQLESLFDFVDRLE